MFFLKLSIICLFIAYLIDNFFIFFRFIYVPFPHTSDVLTEVLIDAMQGWNVDSRLSAITVDNCSTNDSMIGKIKAKLSVDCLLNDGSLLHMRFVAHILNLIVRIGLDVIKHAVDNVRDSVVFGQHLRKE